MVVRDLRVYAQPIDGLEQEPEVVEILEGGRRRVQGRDSRRRIDEVPRRRGAKRVT